MLDASFNVRRNPLDGGIDGARNPVFPKQFVVKSWQTTEELREMSVPLIANANGQMLGEREAFLVAPGCSDMILDD